MVKKFLRFKNVGPKDSNVVTHLCETASFKLKMRTEKVGGNRKRSAVSRHRQLCLS